MPKILTAQGIEGIVAIHEPGANLANPLSDIRSIYFHSSLDYLTVNHIIQTSIYVPPFVGGTVGFINLGPHGMGRACLLMSRRTDTGQAIAGDCLVHVGGGLSNWCTIAACADATNIYFYYAGLRCPGVTVPVEIAVLRNPL